MLAVRFKLVVTEPKTIRKNPDENNRRETFMKHTFYLPLKAVIPNSRFKIQDVCLSCAQ